MNTFCRDALICGGQSKTPQLSFGEAKYQAASMSLALHSDIDASPPFRAFYKGLNGTDGSHEKSPGLAFGTRVRTSSGSALIQDLKINDSVLNSQGNPVKIKWIGRRRFMPSQMNSQTIRPIMIKSGALNNNVPNNNLYVSPDQLIFFDHFLISAYQLINGKTILQTNNEAYPIYYHIVTLAHELIIANNVLVDTSISPDTIGMFENNIEYYRLYPSATMGNIFYVSPRLEVGSQIKHIRHKINLRSGVFQNEIEDNLFIGFLDYADRREIYGWAYSPQDPFMPLQVELLNGNNILASSIANIYRPDVERCGFCNGRYGFKFILPGPLPSTIRHELSVRVIDHTESLPGSPVILDPGIAEDLLRAGGLEYLLQQAVKGARSVGEAEQLGTDLIEIAQKLKTTVARYQPSQRLVLKRVALDRPTILFLDIHWPTVGLDAGSNAVMSHIRAFMSLGYAVEFCASSGSPLTTAESEGLTNLESLGVICHQGQGLLPEAIISDRAKFGIQLVYMHRLATVSNYLGLVRSHLPNAKIIYCVADLHHIRLARQSAVQNSPELMLRAKSVKAAEFYFMQISDCVITHSTAEFDYLRQKLPHINVHVVTWGTTVSPYYETSELKKNIGFIGSASHSPNFDALLNLAHNILPEVWKVEPGVKCVVVGSDWSEVMFNNFDSRIKLSGHQENLSKFFQTISLTVAPIRFGAGIKGKVIESLANAIPCVMSPIAAEGLLLNSNLMGLVGDTKDQASAITGLLSNRRLYHTMAVSGQKLVKKQFSQKSVDAAMARAIEYYEQIENDGPFSNV